MRALVADHSAASGVSVKEAPEPQPGPAEALVEVRAVSRNRGEVRRMPLRTEGTIPGWDVAGVVIDGPQKGTPGSTSSSSTDRASATSRSWSASSLPGGRIRRSA